MTFGILISLLATILTSTALAQPYVYSLKSTSDREDADIYRRDLQTNRQVLFLADAGRIFLPESGNEQKWLFVNSSSGQLKVIECANPANSHILLNHVEVLNGATYVPSVNKFYFAYSPSDTKGATNAAVFDASTFQQIGSIPGWLSWDYHSYHSDDGSAIYAIESDFLSNVENLVTISTATDAIINRQPVNTIGPVASAKGITEIINGKALLRYYVDGPDSSKSFFFVFDISLGTSCSPFSTESIIDATLSGDGRYVILNERLSIIDDSNANIGHDEYPGNVEIYSSITGGLVQRLALSPGGKVLTFANFPDMIYYYLPEEQRSTNIDLNNLPASGKPNSR